VACRPWRWRLAVAVVDPCLIRSVDAGGLPRLRLGVRLLDEYLDFVAEDWFRSPVWDDAPRSGFEARLARARPHNRQRCLRIKGVRLRAAGNNDGGRGLLERAADQPDGYLHETVSAWETLADIVRCWRSGTAPTNA
jgi:hypothetical protein